MRYGLSGASLATYGCKILLAGGVGAGGVLKAVNRLLVYDISTNEWSEGPPMSHVIIEFVNLLPFDHNQAYQVLVFESPNQVKRQRHCLASAG